MSISHRASSGFGRHRHIPKPAVRRDMVFVFGSNTAGVHGGGAARTALLQHGAVYGEGGRLTFVDASNRRLTTIEGECRVVYAAAA